jgi:predicted ATPase
MSAIVGRQEEISRLVAGLDEALGGKGAFFLIAGEAGIGKTAVAREVSDCAAARGFVTTWARGWEGEGAPAYWPFIRIFRALERDFEALAATASSSDPGRRFALFDAAADWLREAAKAKPLLIVIDDLQAVDPSSLSMLVFVARELRGSRIAIVGTLRERDGARGPDVDTEIAKLLREAALVRLERLERDDVAKIVETAKGALPAPLIDLVFRTSEGVPLFVEEVLRAMSAPGAAWMTSAPLPAGVRGAVRDRLARLDKNTRTVLEVASATGLTFTLALVALAAPAVGVSADPFELVERAVAADVVERLGPARYRFAHAMIREALYRDIPGGTRAKLHATILDALATGRADSTIAERAHHALRAASVIGVTRAVSVAREAADAATSMHAFEDAADILRRALAVLDIAPAEDGAVRAAVVGALSLARASAERGTAPPVAPRREETFTLTCEGELWSARLGDAIVRLKDSRGVQMLAQLVERPGEEMHAIALSGGKSDAGRTAPAGDSGDVLDREAIAAYRERLVEVEEELREAESWNDPARIESARSEAEFLRAELSRAVGLGGRSRKSGADVERARVNCQRRIRDAIKRVAEQDATIGKHLLRAVRTGTFCVYDPAE